MNCGYDPDEGAIIRIATHDDMQEMKASLARIEDKISIYCNRNVIDMKKRSYLEGWEACNSEAMRFCRYITETFAKKQPSEIEEFFGVKDIFDIYRKLEKIGLLVWDERRHMFYYESDGVKR